MAFRRLGQREHVAAQTAEVLDRRARLLAQRFLEAEPTRLAAPVLQGQVLTQRRLGRRLARAQALREGPARLVQRGAGRGREGRRLLKRRRRGKGRVGGGVGRSHGGRPVAGRWWAGGVYVASGGRWAGGILVAAGGPGWILWDEALGLRCRYCRAGWWGKAAGRIGRLADGGRPAGGRPVRQGMAHGLGFHADRHGVDLDEGLHCCRSGGGCAQRASWVGVGAGHGTESGRREPRYLYLLTQGTLEQRAATSYFRV